MLWRVHQRAECVEMGLWGQVSSMWGQQQIGSCMIFRLLPGFCPPKDGALGTRSSFNSIRTALVIPKILKIMTFFVFVSMTTILISTARLFSFRNLLLQVFNLPCDPVEDEIVSNKCDTVQQQTESNAKLCAIVNVEGETPTGKSVPRYNPNRQKCTKVQPQ